MSLDLVTVWDGSRTGPNRGLLCVPAEIPRVAPNPYPGAPVTPFVQPDGYGSLTRAIVQLLADGAVWRICDIARTLQRNLNSVNSVIDKMRKRGTVVRCGWGRIQRSPRRAAVA